MKYNYFTVTLTNILNDPFSFIVSTIPQFNVAYTCIPPCVGRFWPLPMAKIHWPKFWTWPHVFILIEELIGKCTKRYWQARTGPLELALLRCHDGELLCRCDLWPHCFLQHGDSWQAPLHLTLTQPVIFGFSLKII